MTVSFEHTTKTCPVADILELDVLVLPKLESEEFNIPVCSSSAIITETIDLSGYITNRENLSENLSFKYSLNQGNEIDGSDFSSKCPTITWRR